MDIKSVVKRGIKRIIQRGVNTLGYEISWRRQPPQPPSLGRPKSFDASPKFLVPSKEQIDAFVNNAIDPDYWRRLNPELSIDGVGERSGGLDIDVLEPKEIEKQIEKLRSEGYFQTNPVLSSPTIEKMRVCVERLRRERWPATFSFVYDEFWDVASVSSLTEIATEFLGAEYKQNSAIWTYYVLPRKGARGWPPHYDSGDPTSRLTVWIPLSDATLDNGCMYLIPQDRVSSARLNDFWSRNYVTKEELALLLWSTKALPAPAGSLLGWNQKILHWGSIASDSAHPRISLAVEFVSARAEVRPDEFPLFDLPCRRSFSQRIQLICNAILKYHGFEPEQLTYKGLAERLKETISS
jgi:hypothetical protein